MRRALPAPRRLPRRTASPSPPAFPFGFLEKSARVTLRREIIVYPPIDPQPGFDDLLAGIAGEIETPLSRSGPRLLPHPPLRGLRKRAPRGLEGLRPHRQSADPRVRPRAGADRRDLPGPRRPARLDAWFEHAVACCAFLAWRLSTQGVAIHFRSNGYLFRQPEDGDIYTILKYLALVYPAEDRRDGSASR